MRESWRNVFIPDSHPPQHTLSTERPPGLPQPSQDGAVLPQGCRRAAGVHLPTFQLCILPRFPWKPLVSSSPQGSPGELGCHDALPGLGNKNKQCWPLPARGTEAAQGQGGFGDGQTCSQHSSQTYSSHVLPTFLPSMLCALLALPCATC